MACTTGNCDGNCCRFPFRLRKRSTQLGQFPTLPGVPLPGGTGPCTTPDGGVGWRTQVGAPCVDMSSGGVGPCVDASGQYGWRTEQGGPCITTIPAQVPPLPGTEPPPGQPAPPAPAGFCTLPDGSIGYRATAGGPCVSPLQQLPGGLPGQPSPGAPPSPQFPGMVTEQQCVAREAAAAEAAKAAEETKVVKYTAIGAVVSGVVGYGLARLLK